MIGELCAAYGALPFPGAVLEQPFAALALGKVLREYAEAHMLYRQDADHCPPAVKRWVLEITAADILERQRDLG